MRKKICLFAACVVMIACILPVFGMIAAEADWYSYDTVKLFCSSCGKQIPTESNYCMYCGHPVVFSSARPSSTPAQRWGEWSAWSTTPVSATENRQIETRTVITGYNMVHYGTQRAEYPHYRVFRNFSVRNDMEGYGARASYGEKHYTRTVSASTLSNAVKYQPGTFISGDYAGYQEGSTTAYYFGDDKYVWFVESTNRTTEYRYRYSY